MKKIFVKIAGVIVNLLAAVGGLATFLTWAGIHPGDFKKMPIPSLPHWTWLIASIILFGVSLRSTLLGIWCDLRPLWYTPNVQPSKSFDAVADFSIATKLVGPWSYGWSRDRMANQFTPFAHSRMPDDLPGVERWESPLVDKDISVMHNPTGRIVRGVSFPILPDMLHMHPGQAGIYDVVRWTCPTSGAFAIVGQFCGLDDNTQGDSDVNVVRNSNTSLFDSTPIVLHGIGSKQLIAFPDISLNAGDTVDFIVGLGPSYGADSTGLKAKIILL